MIIDGEERAITPAAWEVFDDWREKAYRDADVVERIEAAVRAQVAKERAAEEGDRFVRRGQMLAVTSTEIVDSEGADVCYEIWTKGRDDTGESREG